VSVGSPDPIPQNAGPGQGMRPALYGTSLAGTEMLPVVAGYPCPATPQVIFDYL
jgi:hypothetical protein